MKIFKIKIKPEIEKPIYWFHLLGIAFTVLLILQLWRGGDMLNITNVLVSTGLIGIADIFWHTILKLN